MKNKNLRLIIFGGLLVAIAVILKAYLGIPLNMFGSFAKDMNLSPVIVMFSGAVLGPVGGVIVGASTDILTFLIRPLGGYFPLFTITNALFGLIPALFFRRDPQPRLFKLALIVLLTQTICSAILNTLCLVLLGLPIEIAPLRAIGTYISSPVYIALFWAILTATKKLRTPMLYAS